MAAPRGYKKTTGQKGKTYFYDKPKSKDTKIENKLPKGMTTEQFNAKYSKVVWCDYYKCIHNEQPEGLKRTIATLLNNENYKPLGPKDAMIHGVCNKSEIGIKFKELKTSGGIKHKVPECFNARIIKIKVVWTLVNLYNQMEALMEVALNQETLIADGLMLHICNA